MYTQYGSPFFQAGKGCAKSEGGSGCIVKRGGKWAILNNKKVVYGEMVLTLKLKLKKH